jgi:hypothetical protein
MDGLNHGKVTTYVRPTGDGFFEAGRDADVPAHLTDDVIRLHGRPIAGGSHSGSSARPGEPGAFLGSACSECPGKPCRSSETRSVSGASRWPSGSSGRRIGLAGGSA